MSDNAKFKRAEQLWASGQISAAIEAHLELCRTASAAEMRVRSALALVEQLKPVDHAQEVLDAAARGIDAAHQLGNQRTKAYLMAKKAECLVVRNGLDFINARKRLKMAPGWFGFSLTRDKLRFDELTAKIESTDQEADKLMSEAQHADLDAQTKACVLMCAGNIDFQRYLSLKLDAFKGIRRLPTAILRLLREYTLDEFIVYRRLERLKMKSLLNSCEVHFLNAAKAFRSAGDEPNSAYAFYNLANDLRSAYRFRRAKCYLRQAKVTAERYRNQQLLTGIRLLEKSIRVKNSDTPNYAEGERRLSEDDVI